MTTLKDKDYQRRLRHNSGKSEVIISLSIKFLKENNLEVGDFIDLRNLKKVVRKDPDQ